MPKTLNNALTASQVKSLTAPGTYSDGHGLTLKVEPSGTKRWFQRLTIDGKQRNIGLGGYPAVSLADAREAARVNKLAASTGVDPIAAKKEARQARQAVSAIPTFSDAAQIVSELHSPTWTDKHTAGWRASITRYATPVIGKLRVDTITTADVLAVLTPIWTSKYATAYNVRTRMEMVFDWAVASGYRVDNPAGKAVTKALPKVHKTTDHYKALPYAEIPASMKRLREATGCRCRTVRLGLEYLVLTAARLNEVLGATWSEIDWESRTWEIPAARMKARRPHRVPLSDRALEILNEVWDGTDGRIFPSSRGGKIPHPTFGRAMRDLEIPATVHGFRSSFRDWTLEQTATPWAVAESALAHTIGNATETAYARTDLFDKRRALMQAWSDFVMG